jgi:hypothetical protein
MAPARPVVTASVFVHFWNNTLNVYGDPAELKTLSALNPAAATAPWQTVKDVWGERLIAPPVPGYDALYKAGYRYAADTEHSSQGTAPIKYQLAMWTR